MNSCDAAGKLVEIVTLGAAVTEIQGCRTNEKR